MSLNKSTIKTGLKQVYDAAQAQSADYESLKDAFLDGQAQVIVDAIKSAKINYTSGLVAGSTTVTGIFTGSLS